LAQSIALETELEMVLDKVIAGPCFIAAALQTPNPEQCNAPGSFSAAGAVGDNGRQRRCQ